MSSVYYAWRNDTGKWIPYNTATQSKIQLALDSEQSVVLVQIKHAIYSIDLLNNTQTNIDTQHVRNITVISQVLVYKSLDAVNWSSEVNYTRVYPPTYDPMTMDFMGEELGPGGEDDPVVELTCSTSRMLCIFRESVIVRWFDTKPECPNCKYIYHTPGSQPSGEMKVTTIRTSCSGYPNTPTILIYYKFPDGIQNKRMIRPGSRYYGDSRTVYLPDIPEGRYALRLLMCCFRIGKLFRVGDSVTTGMKNVLIWGAVHQKTSMHGGASKHGWPDKSYFIRMQSECAGVGILDLDKTPHQ